MTLSTMSGPNSDLDYYFTSVNKTLLRALKGNNRAIYPSIAYVPPQGKRTLEKTSQVVGEGRDMQTVTGLRVKFPINLSASRPRKWPYGQPRPYENFAAVEVKVDMARWTPPAKRAMWVEWNNDIFGLIQEQLPDMMDRSIILWDEALCEALATNAIWQPDSVAFFTPAGTPHQANPAKPGLASFYNQVAITGIDLPNMRSLIKLLGNQPGPDGVPLDTDELEYVVLAPDEDFAAQCRTVFNFQIAALQVNAVSAATGGNALNGLARVQTYKTLSSTVAQPTFGGVAQSPGIVGYMMAVPRSGEGRPVSVVPAQQPTAYYTGMNGSDHLRATQGAIEFGWDAFGEALLTVPQRIIQFFVNPV
jgi:hypothetical protein